MKLKQLTEGISSVLYHATSLKNAASIIESNEFRLAPTFKNGAEVSTGSTKLFFLSTTRSKTGNYTLISAGNRDGDAILVLDGDALGNNYSGKPVDYWGRTFRKETPTKNEMEDRIYNDNPTIPNALRYIREIHVLFKDKEISSNSRSYLVELKKSGIPIWLYDDVKSYILQIKDNAKPLSEFLLSKWKNRNIYPQIDRDATDKLLRRRAKKTGNKKELEKRSYGLKFWFELLTIPINQFDNLNFDMRNAISNLYGFYGTDMKNSLNADLQNESGKPQWSKRLAPIMRKNGLRTSGDIFNFIKSRWETVADYNYDANK